MITIQNLSKKYANTWAVRNIDLAIPKGELFGFIGPNGAGKTTTIQMIGGLLSPTSGRILINGIEMSKNPVKAKRLIGMIPDRPFLYEKLTAMEFMRFTADIYAVAKNAFHSLALEQLDRFSLKDRSHELIESFSHGMKQRLIMAAALLHSPPIIIVDEPMVGLDPRGIKMVKTLFKNLTDKGTTIFMSTHTLKLAEEICDRVGIIDKGRLIAMGSMDDLKRSANTTEVDLESVFLELTQEPD